ncbi:polysaccharide pyruvyl transferase family protein [Brevibacterium sp. NPDC059310]|uniref:polysaccharide pyruvyl transferase family protein n=1 Tax=Brevibacterium sp. NPDC059310 TaxID=3346802 RepID=UPI00366EFADE
MTKAMLFYGHVASNWGDLAINAGAVDTLRRAGVDIASSTAVTLAPSDAFYRRATFTLKGLSLRTVPVDGTPRGGREEIDLLTGYLADPGRFAHDTGMTDHDVVVLNSGEHLFESAAGDNIVDLVWRVLPALAATAAGLPVVQLPATIGPFHSQLGALIEEFVLDGTAAAAFRETESRRLNTAQREVPVLPDPGFHVPGLRFPDEAPTEMDTLGIVLRPEDMGLRSGSRRTSFVHQKFRDSNYCESRAFALFAAAAEAHIDNGGTVRIIVQTRSDREISRVLADHLTERYGNDSVEYIDPTGFREYLTALGTVDALVTSRFHAVILATAQGVPTAGVYSETHGHKMPGLFDMFRLPDCAVRLDDRDIDTVRTELESALAIAVESIEDTRNRVKANRSAGRRWLTEALQQPPVDGFDVTELRIQALAALYRFGLRRAEDEALAKVRKSLSDLENRMNTPGDTDA